MKLDVWGQEDEALNGLLRRRRSQTMGITKAFT